MHYNETWQGASPQSHLQRLCFAGRSKKKKPSWQPGRWFAGAFSSHLQPLNGIRRNLIGSKIPTSSTKLVFSGRSENQDGRSGLWLDERLLNSPMNPLNRSPKKRDRKQDLIVLDHVCYLRADRETKMAVPASDWLKYFSVFPSETTEETSKKLDKNQDLKVISQVRVFGPIGKIKMAALPDPSIKVTHCTQVHDMLPFGSFVCGKVFHIHSFYVIFMQRKTF